MGLDPQQIEQLLSAEDGTKPVMTTPVYCGQCGYELRMLPYAGRCPECGQPYSARGINPQGLFIPQQAGFPTFNIAAGLASAALIWWLGQRLFDGFDLWTLLFTMIFAFFVVAFLRRAWIELVLFNRGRQVLKRIIEEYNEEDG